MTQLPIFDVALLIQPLLLGPESLIAVYHCRLKTRKKIGFTTYEATDDSATNF